MRTQASAVLRFFGYLLIAVGVFGIMNLLRRRAVVLGHATRDNRRDPVWQALDTKPIMRRLVAGLGFDHPRLDPARRRRGRGRSAAGERR